MVVFTLIDSSYASWCPGDPGEAVQMTYQMYFCKGFRSGSLPSGIPTIENVPTKPTGVLVPDVSQNGPVVGYNLNGTKSDATMSKSFGSGVFVFLATLSALFVLLMI
jgi:hypothetical protein